MPALNAALGLSQFSELDQKISQRLHVMSRYLFYSDLFESKGFSFFPFQEYTHNSHWLYFLKPHDGVSGEKLRELFNSINIMSPPFWKAVSQQPDYRPYLCLPPLFDSTPVVYPDLVQIPITLNHLILLSH